MDPDTAATIHNVAGHMERLLAATGFGMFMAIMVVIATIVLSHGQAGRGWLALLALYVAFVFICMSLWAQGLSFGSIHVSPEVIKNIGIIIATVMALWAVIGIIQRASPGALLGITGILMGCGLVGVMSIWGAPHNMLIIALMLFIVGLVVFIAVGALVLDRHDERKHQALLSQSSRELQLPYTEQKRISPPPNRRNLPAKRDDNGA